MRPFMGDTRIGKGYSGYKTLGAGSPPAGHIINSLRQLSREGYVK
jgi:hypothetical protein